MLTDIQIAQAAQLDHILKIANKIGLTEDDIEFYGKYKAKISQKAVNEAKQNEKNGKLILVTAISPTPMGEGKTTTSIGLGDAMSKIGKKVMYSVSRAAQQAAAMLRSFQWKTSTSISQATFTLSQRLTTFSAQ